ncbi:MAG: hypothetical protein QXG21_02400, partial [Candidatus Caldarchaeum sp.]
YATILPTSFLRRTSGFLNNTSPKKLRTFPDGVQTPCVRGFLGVGSALPASCFSLGQRPHPPLYYVLIS